MWNICYAAVLCSGGEAAEDKNTSFILTTSTYINILYMHQAPFVTYKTNLILTFFV